MDALSDVLRAVRLTGAVFFDVHASEPWVAEAPPGGSIVGTIFPGAEHLISYHVVTRGTCWGGVVGEPPHAPVGRRRHRLSARRRARDVERAGHARHAGPRAVPSAERRAAAVHDLDGRRPAPDPAHLVCGFLGCDARPFNPLLAALPRVIHVSDRDGGALGAFVQFAVAESKAAAARRRVRARPAERADVRGRRPPLSRVAAGRPHGLARRAARSVRRPRAHGAAPAARRATGRSSRSRARSGCRARRWRSASRSSSGSRRCST